MSILIRKSVSSILKQTANFVEKNHESGLGVLYEQVICILDLKNLKKRMTCHAILGCANKDLG